MCLKSYHSFECSIVFVTEILWEWKPYSNANNIGSYILRGSWREFRFRLAFLNMSSL